MFNCSGRSQLFSYWTQREAHMEKEQLKRFHLKTKIAKSAAVLPFSRLLLLLIEFGYCLLYFYICIFTFTLSIFGNIAQHSHRHGHLHTHIHTQTYVYIQGHCTCTWYSLFLVTLDNEFFLYRALSEFFSFHLILILNTRCFCCLSYALQTLTHASRNS